MTRLFYGMTLVLTTSLCFITGLSSGEPAPSSGREETASPPALRGKPAPPVRVGQSRYDWKWLAMRFDRDVDGRVTREELPSPDGSFDRLDRNRDGKLTAEDFDWSEQGPLGRQKETTFALFKSIDTTSDGRITAEEFQALFLKGAGEKGYLTDSDLQQLVFRPAAQKALREQQNRAGIDDLLLDYRKANLPAPNLNEPAPDFTLQSADGATNIRLSSFRKEKTVVLVFGSFT